jgi:hypothetical protein
MADPDEAVHALMAENQASLNSLRSASRKDGADEDEDFEFFESEEDEPPAAAAAAPGKKGGFATKFFKPGEYNAKAKRRSLYCRFCNLLLLLPSVAAQHKHIRNCDKVPVEDKAELAKHLADKAAPQPRQPASNKRRRASGAGSSMGGAGSSMGGAGSSKQPGPMDPFVCSDKPLPHQNTLLSYLTRSAEA